MNIEGTNRGRAVTDTADGYRGQPAVTELDAGPPTEAADVERVATANLPRQDRTPTDGFVLADRYRLGQRIGQGGMATVYRARDEALGREVAVKLFNSDSTDSDELARQQGEVRVLAGLNHHNLVIVYDAGTETNVLEPRTFLVMELVRGTDLHRLRRRNENAGESRLGQGETATMGAGVADALAYIHSQGIVHRDVKPANILLGGEDSRERMSQPKLTDFGIARLVDSARLTATGQSMGTATYFSPEQAQGLAVGPGCDVYSLGLVLLECLTGEVAFPGPAVASAAARVHRDPEIPAALGRGWVELLTAMTARDPEARPAADDVAAVLRSGPAPGALGDAYALDGSADTKGAPTGPITLFPSATGAAGAGAAGAGAAGHGAARYGAAGYADDGGSQDGGGPRTSRIPTAGYERVADPEAPSQWRRQQLDLPDDDDEQGPIDTSSRRKRKDRQAADADAQAGYRERSSTDADTQAGYRERSSTDADTQAGYRERSSADPEPTRGRRRGFSAKKLAVLLLAVAVVAVVVVVLLMLAAGGGVEPVNYPDVPGELGQHLEDLQESVTP